MHAYTYSTHIIHTLKQAHTLSNKHIQLFELSNIYIMSDTHTLTQLYFQSLLPSQIFHLKGAEGRQP